MEEELYEQVAQDLEEELKHSQEEAERLALQLQALERKEGPLRVAGAGTPDHAVPPSVCPVLLEPIGGFLHIY